MSGIKIMNSAAPAGQEKMMIMNDVSGGQLRLFPGSNQVVVGSVQDGGIYSSFKSTDSGDSYEQLPVGYPSLVYGNNAISFNNRYHYVGDPSTVDGTHWIARSKDFGNTWTYDVSRNTATGNRFYNISSSRDGKYVVGCCGSYNVIGEVVLSQDFGETWSRPFSSNEWHRNFIDPGGQNMIIGGYPPCPTKYSDDYGDTWSDFPETILQLQGVMISGDGNVKVVWEGYEAAGGAGARVYVSTNWVDWTQTNLTTRLSNGAISNDGKYILIPCSDGFTLGGQGFNLSSDYGATWQNIMTETGTTLFADAAMSSDGKYMIVIGGLHADVGNKTSYHSFDYGQTWSSIPDFDAYNEPFYVVEMSKSGRYTYTVGRYAGIWHSKDYMGTWSNDFDGSVGSGIAINF